VKEKWIKRCLTLAVLLLSLVSISTAACPRAMPELYKAQCGNVLVVSAPGILKNDIKDPGKTLQVFNPEDISIDPKLGTLNVNADGSFVYEASADFAASGYVIFYYKATDGSCVSNQAYVKIAVSCPCKAIAPAITVCQGDMVDEELLMSMGAKCSGCRDLTPVFDLTGVADAPGTYPYKLACGHITAVGHVTVEVCSPNPECAPASCSNFIPCDAGGSCGSNGVCGSIAEGGGICVNGFTPCAGLSSCTRTSDCAAGEVCGVDSCCGPGVCVPTSAFCSDPGANRATTATTNGGPTAGPTFGGK
jgi:hypothetical protein